MYLILNMLSYFFYSVIFSSFFASGEFQNPDANFHLRNQTSFTMTKSVSPKLYQGFQGFVLLEEGTIRCPLESISRINPFYFTDESQIIELRSPSQGLYTQGEIFKCLWKFEAPNGFGIKTVIWEFQSMDNGNSFTVVDGNMQTIAK